MVNLEDSLNHNKKERIKILNRIKKRNENRKIKCEGCDSYHKIKDLTAVQTYGYVRPRGCTEGDYYYPAELRFICPNTDIENRILFNHHGSSLSNEDSPKEQFRKNYSHLFKEVIKSYDEKSSREWKNNYYVDKNRKKFGLLVKQ